MRNRRVCVIFIQKRNWGYMVYMDRDIANRLVSLRRLNGFSQEGLAEKLGVSRQAVSKWERAEASPDTENLIALSRIYNVSLDELLNVTVLKLEDEEPPKMKAPETAAAGGVEIPVPSGPEKGRRRSLYKFPFPLVVVAAYALMGVIFGAWGTAWVIFLTIPLYYGLVAFFTGESKPEDK